MAKFNTFDAQGNPIVPKSVKDAFVRKQAAYLYPNIFSYGNYGKYQYRYYQLQGANEGIDSLSREYLVRYSRELYAQLPIVSTAIKVLAEFSVGTAYDLEYTGRNSSWAKTAMDWWNEDFSPNCCTRGKPWTFKNMLFLESILLDRDGDFLCVYGIKDGFPQLQIIPNDRIRSMGYDTQQYKNEPQLIKEGPLKGNIEADGIIYDLEGATLGYQVNNLNNVVNSIGTITPFNNVFVSAKDASLIFDGEYIEKHRGLPAIASAVMQGLSVAELDTYLMDKVKLEACVALIEKSPSGEVPMEYQQTLKALQTTPTGTTTPLVSPNLHAVEIQQGGNVRYIKADGGDIKTLASNTPANESAQYMTRLETQILAALGVPHQLIYTPDKVSGRISDGIGVLFNRTVERRQKILDDHGRFIVAWSMANAMSLGLIPDNEDENLFEVFRFTHPDKFSLNAGYERQGDLQDYQAGLISLSDIAQKRNKTATEVLQEREKEAIEFFTRAKNISNITGININTVIQSLREDVKSKPVVAQSEAA